MKKNLKIFIGFLLLGIGLANIFMFCWWAKVVDFKKFEMSTANYNHFYDRIATNFTILEVILGFVAFSTAVLGFYGYNSIKEEVINQTKKIALEETKKIASQEMVKFVNNRGAFEDLDSFTSKEELPNLGQNFIKAEEEE